MPAPDPHVRIERDGAVGHLVFDHEARRNAMTLDMWRAVPRLCADLTADDAIRVVVLRGAGERAFVAGADISQFEQERSGTSGSGYEEATNAAYRAITDVPKPTIAMIHGFCIGGGLAIALCADLRYAADDVEMALPPAKLGIGYSVEGIRTLVDLVGPSVTLELVYSAERFGADTVLRWGLVNQIVPKADLAESVRAVATTIASRAPLSQRAAKLAVQGDARAADLVAQCFTSDDYAEGVAAFLEKRTPHFRGH